MPILINEHKIFSMNEIIRALHIERSDFSQPYDKSLAFSVFAIFIFLTTVNAVFTLDESNTHITQGSSSCKEAEIFLNRYRVDLGQCTRAIFIFFIVVFNYDLKLTLKRNQFLQLKSVGCLYGMAEQGF